METKINTSFRFRSSFSGGRSTRRNTVSLRNTYKNSLKTKSTRSDVLSESSDVSTSYFRGSTLSGSRRSRYSRISRNLNDIKISSGYLQADSDITEKDDYKDKAVNNFKLINNAQKNLNVNIPKWLNEAGIPENVEFEFDYNIDTQKAEVTKISDEKYRDTVETVLNQKMGKETLYTAYASRIMNGHASSAYRTDIANSLKNCFGQDINELSIDKKGNLCGANTNLQRALKASKYGREYTYIESRRFPAKDIEGVLKKLLSDKNIAPNVSHMGYDGKSMYTNDGKFKLGKKFDQSMLNKNLYAMRGSIALASELDYDAWLKIQ